MGNAATYRRYISEPDTTPDADEKPTFDPMMGFPNGRKPRKMIAKENEMYSARIPHVHRDYCAHFWLKLFECRADNFPFIDRCAHQAHDWNTCEFEDYKLRMMEYERERRLRVLRKKELAEAA